MMVDMVASLVEECLENLVTPRCGHRHLSIVCLITLATNLSPCTYDVHEITQPRGAIREPQYRHKPEQISSVRGNVVTTECRDTSYHFRTSAWDVPLSPHWPSLQEDGPSEHSKVGGRFSFPSLVNGVDCELDYQLRGCMGAIVKRSVPSLCSYYLTIEKLGINTELQWRDKNTYVSISASIPSLEPLDTSLTSDWVLSSLFDAKSALALALALIPVPALAFG